MNRAFTFELSWGNPYTTPPDGAPRTLLSVTREVSSTANVPEEIRAAWRPGNGYAIRIYPANEPAPRRISQAGRASIRRKRLEARTRRKLPLFYDQVVAEALAARPDYFAGADYPYKP